jgi:small basic protein (TIGR04137 family)
MTATRLRGPFGRVILSLPHGPYIITYSCNGPRTKDEAMSIDKSLRRKNTLERARNVLTRGERIKQLKDEERWPEARSPYGLPKVKVVKVVVKKVKKAKEEEKPAAEGEEGAAAAAAPAADKKGADKKGAEKK